MFDGYLPFILQGALTTLKLASTAAILGSILGCLGAWAKLSHNRIAYAISASITSVIRGLPELMVLFIIYFGSTVLLSNIFESLVNVNGFWAGVTALSLIFGAYLTETLRGAYLAIDKGQIEAAQAYGFSRWKCGRYIILPQLWHYALPGIGNLWLVLIKDTAIVSLIGLSDMMRIAQLASAQTGKPFTFYLLAASFYLVLTSVSMLMLRYTQVRQRWN